MAQKSDPQEVSIWKVIQEVVQMAKAVKEAVKLVLRGIASSIARFAESSVSVIHIYFIDGAVWRGGRAIDDESKMPSAQLQLDSHYQSVHWNGRPVSIRAGSEFLVFSTVVAAQGQNVCFEVLHNLIGPIQNQQSSQKAHPKLRSFVSAINGHLRNAGARIGLHAQRGSGYCLKESTNS